MIFATCFIFTLAELKEFFELCKMSFCYLLDDGCLYLSIYICTLAQYKKNKVFYSLYFSLRSGASVFAGSCQGHISFYIAKVSLYPIEDSFKMCFVAVYKGQRGQFLFIKVV